MAQVMPPQLSDEWQAAERAYMSQTSMAKVVPSINAPPSMIKEVATG